MYNHLNTSINRKVLRDRMWAMYDQIAVEHGPQPKSDLESYAWFDGVNVDRTAVHRAWCRALARLIGWNRCFNMIPFRITEVSTALAQGDLHLNSLSPVKWDRAGSAVAPWCLSDGVCVLKEVARCGAEDAGAVIAVAR